MDHTTAVPGSEGITWCAMAPKQSRTRAVVSSAVAGTIRGLALVVERSPQPRRRYS